MVDSIVTRTLDIDFIYFDLIFLTIWIFFLVKKGYKLPLIWGLIGSLIYLIIDFGLWYLVLGNREYFGSLPTGFFFLWFCFSPGFAQFSYVFVMFEQRNKKELFFWTGLFYFGWMLVSLSSQFLSINDGILIVSRNMNAANQRIIFAGLVLFNLVLGIFLVYRNKLSWTHLVYIFMVGTLVELNLEFSLAISGIRLEEGTWSWELFIINTLIEFNMGIVIMYLIWQKLANNGKIMKFSNVNLEELQTNKNTNTKKKY